MLASLKFPVLGCTKIRIIKKHKFGWLAELIEAELFIEVYEDDFVREEVIVNDSYLNVEALGIQESLQDIN